MNKSEREFYEKYTSSCMHGGEASCACACPFNLEVALFVDKIKINSYTGAYRLYQESVVFPEIVSHICPAPCKAHCVFGEEAIQLPTLEKTCLANIKDKKPSFYNMPPKSTRVAVIGAGLSGLTCALKLRMKNYGVTIFEKSDRIGGNLWNLLDSEIFMADIETQFEYFGYDVKLNTEITDLDALAAEFDAVYIATGSDGADFGLTGEMDRKSFGSSRPGVFLGGRLIGGSDMDAIEHGKIASFSIEKYIQIGKMDGVSTTYHVDSCNFPAPKAASRECPPATIPSGGEIYTKEEAQAEARRCLKCDCSACYDRCELMQSIRQYPVKMAKDALVSLFPIAELDGKRISTHVVGTCLQCGACRDFCPTGIDMEKFFNDFRGHMVNDGTWPAFHNFFVEDFKFSEKDDVRAVLSAPDGKKGEYAFFPGCQLGGSSPEAVKKTYSFLLEKLPGTSLMMMCCGVPAHWAGQAEMFREHVDRIRSEWEGLGKPTLILACMSCQKTFEMFLPEISVVSLYEVLSGLELPAATTGGTAAVFDPCSSRKRGEVQKSVRALAQGAGYALEELENYGEEAECCGYGGHTHFAKPAYTAAITEKRVSQSELPYIVYCANCRESFAEKGKECRHILDVIFGIETRPGAATKSDRRQVRRALRAEMLEEFWGEGGEVFSPYDHLVINGALREMMHERYIVADDLFEAIRIAEESGRVLYDPETKLRIAHLRVGDRTHWTTYIKNEDGGYELQSAYSHRVNIVEE